MTAFLGLPAWVPQWNFNGSLDYARVSSSDLGANPAFVCVEAVAHKARPDVRFAEFVDRVYPPVGDFWLGLARDALLLLLPSLNGGQARATSAEDAIERAVRQDSRREWPDASKVVALHAVRGYQTVIGQLSSADPAWADAVFAPSLVLSSEQGSSRTEWTCWGLFVVRDAGRVRETHLLRHRGAGTRPLPDQRVAAASHIGGDGFVPDPGLSFWEPFEPAHAQPPACERVVVREVAVLDGTEHVLFDGTPSEAQTRFAATVPHVLDLFRGGAFRPGSRCASCKHRPYCPGIRQVRGALGVVPRSPHTRAVSPGDLSDQLACARRVWLRRDLGLPRVPTDSGFAAERGSRVHRWLEAAHARGVPCSLDDVPEDSLPGLAADLGWTEGEYREARPFLVGHVDCCFMDGARGVELERDVTLWDTECNVVFSTRLDATYVHPDFGRVLRETKTISPARLKEIGDEYDLIEMFPQVAFALSMLAIGWDPVAESVIGPDEGRGLVELELLWGDDSTVVPYDPGNREQAMTARRFLADAVDRRITDTEHRPSSGRQCQWCAMRDWCDARTDTAVWVAPEAQPLAAATLSERRTLVELLTQPWTPPEDDDVPF